MPNTRATLLRTAEIMLAMIILCFAAVQAANAACNVRQDQGSSHWGCTGTEVCGTNQTCYKSML